jgi:Protein of unknown function (DUF1207)
VRRASPPSTRCRRALLAVASLVAVGLAPASALQGGGRHRLIAFPTGHYYLPPIADLHRAAFGVALAEVYEESIADSGSPRYFLRVGGEFGLLRWEAASASDGIQLDLIAGMDGQFDLDHSLDNIGWDGNYGLQASTRLRPALAVKLGLVHTSSHIGDELEERTGRQRIGYGRDELVAGVRRDLGRDLSFYGEAGYGYKLSEREVQEPWRLQTGLDFDPALRAEGRRTGWFLGVDLSATEERDQRVDVAIKAGRTFRLEDRVWRLGLELYDGRPNLGEFFQDTERHVALGVWLDI